MPTSYDTSFALTVGGGLDVRITRHIKIRAVQADYFYSELRNLQGDRQNQFRIGAGVLFHGSAWKWSRGQSSRPSHPDPSDDTWFDALRNVHSRGLRAAVWNLVKADGHYLIIIDRSHCSMQNG